MSPAVGPLQLVAHRFGRAYGPDSSAQALHAALDGPIAGVETDCCLTADDEIVLLHEPFLPRATTAAGWARERPAQEILAARLLRSDGRPSDERPLRLEEALELLAGRGLTIQLEVKAHADAALARRTARVVCDRVAASRHVDPAAIEVISFWPDACELAAAHGLASRAIVACPYLPDALAEWAAGAGLRGVILEAPAFAEPVTASLRARNLSVMCGVVNDPDLLARVLPFAPDAIASDRPHELRREISEHGARP